MSLTGEPGRPADEERPVARRPLRRLRRRRSRCSPASGARGATASAATATSRSSRPRSRELMYVGTWAATARLRAARDAPNSAHPSIVPFQNFRDRGRLDRRRVRRSRSSGSALCDGDRPRRTSPTTRASPTSPRRDEQPRRAARRCSTTAFARARRRAEWLAAPRRGGRALRAGQRRRRARSTTRRRRARERSSSYEHPRLGDGAPDRHAAAGRADEPPPVARGPVRGASTPTRCCAELCGYPPERIAALRAAGVFGRE